MACRLIIGKLVTGIYEPKRLNNKLFVGLTSDDNSVQGFFMRGSTRPCLQIEASTLVPGHPLVPHHSISSDIQCQTVLGPLPLITYSEIY